MSLLEDFAMAAEAQLADEIDSTSSNGDFYGIVDPSELQRKEILAPFSGDPAEGLRVHFTGFQSAEFIFVGFTVEEVRNYATLMLRPPQTASLDLSFVGNPSSITEGRHLVCVGSNGSASNPEVEYAEIEGLLARFEFSLDHPGRWTVAAMSINAANPQIIDVVSSEVVIHVSSASPSTGFMADEPEPFFPFNHERNLFSGLSTMQGNVPAASDTELVPPDSETESAESMDHAWNFPVHVKEEPIDSLVPPPPPTAFDTFQFGDRPNSADLTSDVSPPMSPIDSIMEIEQAISYEIQVVPEPPVILAHSNDHPKIMTVLSQTADVYTSIIHDMERTVDRVRAESKASVNPIQLLKRIPLFEQVLGDHADLAPRLSRPSVLPVRPSERRACYWVAAGTEDYRKDMIARNYLVFAGLDHRAELVQGATMEMDGMRLRDRDQSMAYLTTRMKVRDLVRDVKWLSNRYCMAAIGNSVAYVDFQQSVLVPMRIEYLPGVHSTLIREMQLLGTADDPFVLTCGFDGRVALQNMATGRVPFNVVVDPEASISSVRSIEQNISCTSDQGSFYLFDRRVSKKVSEIGVQNLGQAEVYTHNYLSRYELLLGTSDGQVLAFDNRYQKEPMVSYLNLQERLANHAVGDLVVDRSSKSFFTFGTGSIFSTWKYAAGEHTQVKLAALTNTQAVGAEELTCAGDIFEPTSMAFVTDSDGVMSVYKYK